MLRSFPGDLKELFIFQEPEIFNFNLDTIFDEGVFRKIFIQVLYLFSIASINRRNGCQRDQFHELLLSGLQTLPLRRSGAKALAQAPTKITELGKIKVGIVNYLNTKPLL